MPKHHIFTLPQELQDIIFNYAYGLPSTLHDLVNVDSRKRDETTIFQSHPPAHKVSEWLINKHWFVSAARTYAESATVPMSIQTIDATPTKMEVLHAFATTMSAHPEDLMRARSRQLPRLRRLQLVPIRPNDARWHATPLIDDEIRGLDVYRGLARWLAQCPKAIVDGLVRVRVHGSGSDRVLSEEEVARLMKFCREEVECHQRSWAGALQRILDPPMPQSESKDEQRLYAGSRVRADGSILLPIEWGVMAQDSLRYLGIRSEDLWPPGREEVCGSMAELVLAFLAKGDPRLEAISVRNSQSTS